VIILLALAPAEPKGDSAEVKKLLQKRVEVLRKAHEMAWSKFKLGPGSLEEILSVLRRLAKAETEAADGPAKRREALLRVFQAAVKLDEFALKGVKAGTYAPATFLMVREFRLKVEIDLRRAGGAPPRGTKPPEELKFPLKRP
jgi:hypothetical protein